MTNILVSSQPARNRIKVSIIDFGFLGEGKAKKKGDDDLALKKMLGSRQRFIVCR